MTQPQANQLPPNQANPLPPIPAPVYPDLREPDYPNPEKPRPSCDGGTVEPLPDPLTSPVPPPPEGTPRIMIAIPMISICWEFFSSFMRLWTELLTTKPPYEISYHIAWRKPVHMAEEYLVKIAQYNKCTHILFMDEDIFDVRRSDIDKLLAADKDVIGGVMHASKFPHAMCVFRRYDNSKKVIDMPADTSMYRLYEVPCTCHACGMNMSHWDAKYCPGCGAINDNLIQQADLIPFALTLMKMSVFDKISKPWFHCNNGYPTDSWFSDKLQEAGMTEYAHMGVRLNHNGITDETKPHYINMGMVKAKATQGVIELTPEQMDMHQRLLYHKMQETENRQKPKPPFIKQGEVAANELEKDYTIKTVS